MRTRSEPPLHIAASQINGRVFCVDMHTQEALADGEDLTRLFLLSVWHETPLFSGRARPEPTG